VRKQGIRKAERTTEPGVWAWRVGRGWVAELTQAVGHVLQGKRSMQAGRGHQRGLRAAAEPPSTSVLQMHSFQPASCVVWCWPHNLKFRHACISTAINWRRPTLLAPTKCCPERAGSATDAERAEALERRAALQEEVSGNEAEAQCYRDDIAANEAGRREIQGKVSLSVVGLPARMPAAARRMKWQCCSCSCASGPCSQRVRHGSTVTSAPFR
jgi:hypothetical protein